MGRSWARDRLAYDRVWRLTRGQGVTAAVVDSGADTGHPMLSGRVSERVDLTGTGDRDCLGHGTAVASLIGGRDLTGRGVPLSGVAPEVRLLVVKQQNADEDERGGDRLPGAIRRAADRGAKVINVSIRARPSPDLERAVRHAQDRDAVVVAAAGNAEKRDGDPGPAYPASYPGVLSVAALGPDGARAETSSLQSRVDLGAPGKDVPAAWTGSGYNPQAQGTSFAAAYVTGVAALVRSYHPGLRQDQVVRRVLATADGSAGDGTGRGMVNPVQAVTAVVPGENGGPVAPRPAPAPATFAAPAPVDGRTRDVSAAVAGGALAAAALAALTGVIVPLGRRRGWRPGRVDLSSRPAEDDPVAEPPTQGTIGAPRS
ncbi:MULTISPECIES: S8 family serine peptidase [Actinomadura]|uniref:S8 family serine peptidase n=1 Tax=Actinomadura yumaensis TaxID=111807 RepID=A0ABW2CM41_9ACTN|nr:S8 family serine peptidase [Actinomadura sp. J1-007]MWK34247.1 S8 family serine peptidase [Actinomadura sp. J1-007]